MKVSAAFLEHGKEQIGELVGEKIILSTMFHGNRPTNFVIGPVGDCHRKLNGNLQHDQGEMITHILGATNNLHVNWL